MLLKHATLEHAPTIVVDDEYPGHQDVIRTLVAEMWRSPKPMPQPYFRQIGKGSPAHDFAHKSATGKRKARVLSYAELRELAITK